MKNKDVILKFLDKKICNTQNLFSTTDKLFSYQTCIAQWDGNNLILNMTKYSPTTSKHLNMLLRQLKCLPNLNIYYVYNIKRNTNNLIMD